jgi:F-type H+-transporting ATPase subunit a
MIGMHKSNIKRAKSVLLVILFTFGLMGNLFAQQNEVAPTKENISAEHHEEGKLDIKGEIFGHISDSYGWHLFDLGGHPVSVPLPVILINPTNGVKLCMSSAF